MEVDEIQRKLESAGLALKNRNRNGNNTGFELRFKSGEIVNVFDNGNTSVQGKNQAQVREILGIGAAVEAARMAGAPSRKVFVVYGHDSHARVQLEAMLRRWDLEPLILDQLPSEGQTLIEKLEKYSNDEAVFAVVLATPDDEGNVAGKPDERKFRARQNVVMELGLLLGKLGRSRVAILLKKQESMERPSDT
jgi:predicted nucleotide-binding protein